MNIRVVALDLDGTLLRSDGSLSERSVQAVTQASSRGVHVVLATGRPPRTVRPIHEALGLQTPSIHYNGALVRCWRTDTVLHHQPLDATLAWRVVHYARRLYPPAIVHAELEDRWYTDRLSTALRIDNLPQSIPDRVAPLRQWLRHQPVTKLMFLAPPGVLRWLWRAIAQAFRSRVVTVVNEPHLLQIVERRVDKAAALKRIARELDVPASQVMAVGDAMNDLGMLRWAGVPVAVANASEQIKSLAVHVVPSNDAEGVAHAIERHVLDSLR